MISGYQVGTEVKWNLENTLTTGTIERVFRESDVIEIDGRRLIVNVSRNSPTYLVRHHSGQYLVLPHQDVMLKRTNLHT